MRCTREEFNNVIANPPSSWTDYNMDWTNPNPDSFVYWYTLFLALQQRIDVLINLPKKTHYDLPPYSNSMRQQFISMLMTNLTYVRKVLCRS